MTGSFRRLFLPCLLYLKLTKFYAIENFSGAKDSGKVFIIIMYTILIIIIIVIIIVVVIIIIIIIIIINFINKTM